LIIDKFFSALETEGEDVYNWTKSLVDHIQPKYTVQLADYLTPEEIQELKRLGSNYYPVFPPFGHLKPMEDWFYRKLIWNWDEGQMLSQCAPLKQYPDLREYVDLRLFEGLNYEKYKEFLLDFFSKEKAGYHNFGEKYLEDYPKLEDLALVHNKLRDGLSMGIRSLVKRPSFDVYYFSSYFRSLFWKGIVKLKI